MLQTPAPLERRAVGTEEYIYGTAQQFARFEHARRKTERPEALRARRTAQEARTMEDRRPRVGPAQDQAGRLSNLRLAIYDLRDARFA